MLHPTSARTISAVLVGGALVAGLAACSSTPTATPTNVASAVAADQGTAVPSASPTSTPTSAVTKPTGLPLEPDGPWLVQTTNSTDQAIVTYLYDPKTFLAEQVSLTDRTSSWATQAAAAASFSRDGHHMIVFNVMEAGTTTVPVADVDGGTGVPYDVSTAPGFVAGSVVEAAAFDLDTPAQLVVTTRAPDGSLTAFRYDTAVDGASATSEPTAPTAETRSLDEYADGATQRGSDTNEYPWGTEHGGTSLTDPAGGQWRATANSTDLKITRQVADDSWQTVGGDDDIVALIPQQSAPAAVLWFRPRDLPAA